MASRNEWTSDRVEALLGSLTGVVSARIVIGTDGSVEEVHVLTTDEVSPKQTVRNVESALLAHYDIELDHRRISVAQTSDYGAPAEGAGPLGEPLSPSRSTAGTSTLVQPIPSSTEGRILFQGHQVEVARAPRVRMRVAVEWRGEQFTGDAESPDVPHLRLEALANAVLRAVEAAIRPPDGGFSLALDGVQQIDTLGRRYVLVSVHAVNGTEVTPLAGTSAVDDSADRAVIQAALQATDRWVRGRA